MVGEMKPFGGEYGVAVDQGDNWMHFRHPKAKAGLLTPQSENRATTMAESWNRAQKKFSKLRCLGTRELISSELVNDSSTGKALEKNVYGKYTWMTYEETNERILAFSRGLLDLGVQPKSNVCIFMNSMADWQVAANACFQTSIVVGTIYATLGEEALAYGFNQTKSCTVITEGSLLPVISNIAKDCPHIKHIIYNGVKPENINIREGITLYAFEDIIQASKSKPEVKLSVPNPDDVAVIMYTSGSTGLPKGVVLTHSNMVTTILGYSMSLPNLVPGEDCFIAFLPLAHIFALCAESFLIANGCRVGYGTALTLTDNSPKIKSGSKGDISELRPTYMVAVPTIMDRIRQVVTGKVATGSRLKQNIFKRAFEAKQKAVAQGETTPLWDLIVFNKIKAVLGGRVKLILAGGAPLATDSQKFVSTVFGVSVCQGYGLTESCGAGAIASMNDRNSFGTVGGPLATVDIKIVDWDEGNYKVSDKDDASIGMPRGEVLMSGGCITPGYFNMPDKKAEDFQTDINGKVWFHTGDIGQIHPNGSLQIIDRKKDLIKLQQGEYVSLGKVESLLKAATYIDNMMVYADPWQSYCVAVVTVIPPVLKAWSTNKCISKEWDELVKDPRIVAEVLASVQKEAAVNKLARFETPQRLFISSNAWLPDSGLVTASMKLKRNQLTEHFKEEINAMYT